MNNNYCVYLTIYSGSKLPPFYIGSGTLDKILNKGYRGSVTSKQFKKIWSQELKFYHNPYKKDQIRLKPNQPIPNGYIEGRLNFGTNGNPFNDLKIGIDVRTKLKSQLPKSDISSKFIIPHNCKTILEYNGVYGVNKELFVSYILSNFELNLSKRQRTDFTKWGYCNPCKIKDVNIINVEDYVYIVGDIWL